MIGLDTNVLVRYIMQDDPKQSPLSNRLIESLTQESPGFVSIVSIVEIFWVLSSVYDLGHAELIAALEAILHAKELVVERAEIVWKAVRQFQTVSADFADCLIACSGSVAGCGRIITFDRAAAKSGGMTLITEH